MARRTLYIIIGGIVLLLILIGIGVFAILPTITSANGSQTPTVTPTTVPATTPQHKGNGIGKVLRQYAPQIKSQIAQGLHLTPTQLTAQLQSGKTLSNIATTQGVSATDLQTLETNAIQTSLQPAVDDGTLTTQQVTRATNQLKKNPQQLDKLLLSKTKQTATPTPAQ